MIPLSARIAELGFRLAVDGRAAARARLLARSTRKVDRLRALDAEQRFARLAQRFARLGGSHG